MNLLKILVWKIFEKKNLEKKLIFLTIFYIFLKLFINKYTVNKTLFFLIIIKMYVIKKLSCPNLIGHTRNKS